jgi:hypothetical protein
MKIADDSPPIVSALDRPNSYLTVALKTFAFQHLKKSLFF